jgi:hypothetical protein
MNLWASVLHGTPHCILGIQFCIEILLAGTASYSSCLGAGQATEPLPATVAIHTKTAPRTDFLRGLLCTCSKHTSSISSLSSSFLPVLSFHSTSPSMVSLRMASPTLKGASRAIRQPSCRRAESIQAHPKPTFCKPPSHIEKPFI